MDRKETSKGISIFTILFLIFLVLKLVPGTSVNEWSWLWVLSPIWIPFAIVIAFIVCLAIFCFIMVIGSKIFGEDSIFGKFVKKHSSKK